MKSSTSKRKFFLTVFLLAMAICNLILGLRVVPKLRNGYQDFTIFYTGALLVRDGHASTLYNLATQYRVQQAFTNVPIRLGPLPFNHPPFEALVFIPFTFLPYWPAYLIWTVMNLGMLAASVVLLNRHFRLFAADSFSSISLGVAGIAFFPIAMGVIQGQDIIVLLLLYVLAIVSLDQGKNARAGALLGAGLFRPHWVIPLAVLLALRRWRLLTGFVPMALLAALTSVIVVGWHGTAAYVQFVTHLETTKSRAFGPEAVPNLRGLISELPGLDPNSALTHFLIFASSMVVLYIAVRRIRKSEDSIVFTASLATLTTLLINFHAMVYDLTLLFPMLSFLIVRAAGKETREPDLATSVLVLLLFLSPLYVFVLLKVQLFFLFTLLELWLFARQISASAPADMPA